MGIVQKQNPYGPSSNKLAPSNEFSSKNQGILLKILTSSIDNAGIGFLKFAIYPLGHCYHEQTHFHAVQDYRDITSRRTKLRTKEDYPSILTEIMINYELFRLLVVCFGGQRFCTCHA